MMARLLTLALAVVLAGGFNSYSRAEPMSETLQGLWADAEMDGFMAQLLMSGKTDFGSQLFGKPVNYFVVKDKKFILVEGRSGVKVTEKVLTFTVDAQNINLKTELGDKYVMRYILQKNGNLNLLKIRNNDGSTTTYIQLVSYKDKADANAAMNSRKQITDSRDGKKYLTVKIDNQLWMAQDLNFETKTGSWCYDNNESNCDKYGRLYDWNTANTACPTGWRLPSREEWGALANAVGGTGEYGGEGTAGKVLKSSSGWYSNGNGIDNYGFAALPGGNRKTDGTFGGVGQGDFWWTATKNEDGRAYIRRTSYGYDYVPELKLSSDNGWGLSVRCLQDN